MTHAWRALALRRAGLAAGLAATAALGQCVVLAPGAVTSGATVTWVTDGDTLHVVDGSGADLGSIRLLGINAPELGRGHAAAQCWATQARDRLVELAPVGSAVGLVSDPTQPDRDRYGRLLRYVLVEGQDVQLTLLREGQAEPYWPADPVSRGAAYRAAAEAAARAQRGLWSACPDPADDGS